MKIVPYTYKSDYIWLFMNEIYMNKITREWNIHERNNGLFLMNEITMNEITVNEITANLFFNEWNNYEWNNVNEIYMNVLYMNEMFIPKKTIKIIKN